MQQKLLLYLPSIRTKHTFNKQFLHRNTSSSIVIQVIFELSDFVRSFYVSLSIRLTFGDNWGRSGVLDDVKPLK